MNRLRNNPPGRRVDVHFHVLPGVDDGPATLEESLELAACAAHSGTATIVATPHVSPSCPLDVSELPERVASLQAELDRAGVPIHVCCAAELDARMVGRLAQAELDVISIGPPGRRWLLVESPFGGLDPDFNAATDELRDRGFAIVVAHPERSADPLAETGMEVVRYELARGSVVQLNAWSLAGRHGGESRDAARELLGLAGDAAVVASDAHGGWRLPALDLGVESLLAAGLDGASAERLVGAAPRRLVERGLEPAPTLGATGRAARRERPRPVRLPN